ncbi:aromatic ring-hydroxylating oxygenase subunit alpha [Galbitalea soli]|uniref:Aromatic ring-hydroxylating dioxygenase subunit alpha n=1 Tax=Galbitalea soli TaxID=1268042 RepID=A0A7C9TT03_9MICO|nr:aromatic ring-hydroxylating dioxygenase subunit alpha [Galbitalea soli]NEM92220.1 aromatic ring-hydroxylating dioxygenase subunit alpha [Galbitalea soli]NYJ31826.1 phenylpropionate dioxygenase-like ring-hydroxylating dioxygenase large terminal subunit [Galbitalea soli]
MTTSAPARVTRHHGPEHLRLSEQPLFRRFWYAVSFASAVSDRPIARTLLGTRVVVWRATPDSAVSVALDRCAHRDAPLSKGWIENCHLVCPYHGWEWDRNGETQRIPQFPVAPHPTKSGLTMVSSQERYGMVWVCLAGADEGGPLADIPPIPEFDAEGWRVVPEAEWHFDCSAAHLLENNFDGGHVAFVHANTFGDRSKPELTETEVTRTAYGLQTYGEVPVDARPGESGATVRRSLSRLYLPFFGHISITYPDGLVHIMIKAITPIDDEHCQLTQTVLRNDGESDRPAADILAFDERVETEDRDLLESLPKEYPLAPHLNAHAKADRNSLAIRRLWSDFVTGEFRPAPENS